MKVSDRGKILFLDVRLFSQFWKKNSFFRFVIIGTSNTILMFIFYSLIIYVIGENQDTAGIAWGIAWGLECCIAYMLHRKITFQYIGSYSKSGFKTFLVYSITLLGSSLTWDTIYSIYSIPYFFRWLGNLAAWGIISYLLLNYFAMPSKNRMT